MKLSFFQDTDRGLVRKANEDSVGHLSLEEINGYGNVFIVCDGMGGHVGGARASQKAVDTIKEYFSSEPNSNPQIALKQAVEFANMQIFAEAQSNPDFTGMGTTVTVLLEKESFIYIAHVGDSRIYINKDNVLYRITKDHSFVQGLVDAGQLKDEEMELHPRKNELSKALGIADRVEVEVNSTPILAKKGDKFMLCSDGLCGLVNDTTMMNTINSKKDIKSAVNELILLAKNAGGHDNISVIIIDVLESEHPKTKFSDKSNVKLKRSKSIMDTAYHHPDNLMGSSDKFKYMKQTILIPSIIGVFVLLGGFFAWKMMSEEPILGCTDSTAINYNPNATQDPKKGEGKCKYELAHPPIKDGIIKVDIDGQNFEDGSVTLKEKIDNSTQDYKYSDFTDEVKDKYIVFNNDGNIYNFLAAKIKYYSSTKTFKDAFFIFKKKDYEESLVGEYILPIIPNLPETITATIEEDLKSIKMDIEAKKPSKHINYSIKGGYDIEFKRPIGFNKKKWNHTKGQEHKVKFTVKHRKSKKSLEGKYTCTYKVEQESPLPEDTAGDAPVLSNTEKLTSLIQEIESKTEDDTDADGGNRDKVMSIAQNQVDDVKITFSINPKAPTCEPQTYEVTVYLEVGVGGNGVNKSTTFYETIPLNQGVCDQNEIKTLLNSILPNSFWTETKFNWSIVKLDWELSTEDFLIDEVTIGDKTLYNYSSSARKIEEEIKKINTTIGSLENLDNWSATPERIVADYSEEQKKQFRLPTVKDDGVTLKIQRNWEKKYLYKNK